MIVSIHQPSYFPWLGLLDKINKSDLFVVLDNVQLSDSAYQNRNLFLSNQGKEQLLTIPINRKNYLEKTIKDIEINNSIWQKKHSKFIYFNYKKHPYFDEIYKIIECIYTKEYINLSELLIESLKISCNIFDIDTKIIRASDLPLDDNLKKESKVVSILKQVGAATYLSGQGAKSYQLTENFEDKHIKLTYQEFTHPIYSQHKMDKFISGLSSLDATFNLGKDNSFTLLKKP